MVVRIVAENVAQLRDRAFADLPNVTARNRRLAKESDTTLSQIQRIVAEDVAAGIDVIERIAKPLKVSPQDLLTPYFVTSVLPRIPPAPDPDLLGPGLAIHDRQSKSTHPKSSY
jgi:hypothetical protein